MWIAIIIGVLVLVGAICVGMKKHNNLVSSGEIISRRPDFMENAEEFTLSVIDPAAVTEAVKAMDYNAMHTGMNGSSEQQTFKFTGSSWTAKLYKLSENDTQVVYRFEFTGWKTHNGMPQDGLNMNKLTTAVEKMFLGFDPNTQVREVPLELKTKHSFL